MEEVRDFNPERCPYTWESEINGVRCGRVRCTMRANDAGHDHEWRAEAQEEWTALTKRTVIEEMER